MDKALLKVLNGAAADCIPFWFMRQAGRYLPEYRALREEKGGFLAMAMDPSSACEITMQPIRRFGMDAAIIFSDILTVPMALGQKLEFLQGEGPSLEPVRDFTDLQKLTTQNFDEILQPVYEALRLTRAQLIKEGFDQTALIGFAGAPWTVATYMVEGGSSRDFHQVLKCAYSQPEFFTKLIDLLTETTARYLEQQMKAGAEVLQIFDSWSGALSPREFQKWVIAPTKKILDHLRKTCPNIPVICFPKGAGLMLPLFLQHIKPDALSLDHHVDLNWAIQNIAADIVLQGNLDPMAVLAGGDVLTVETQNIFETLKNRPMIFNLGHGIHKDTPVEHVEKLVHHIKNYKV
jgi:uroporphyrinogen decarboxylase